MRYIKIGNFNKQQIVNKIFPRLLEQGEKSMNMIRSGDGAYRCAYRGDNDSACAIGQLISRQHYTKELEGTNVKRVDIKDAVCKSQGWNHRDVDWRWMLLFQSVHDTASTTLFREEFIEKARYFCANHNLTCPI